MNKVVCPTVTTQVLAGHDPRSIAEAAAAIHSGRLVVLATDTVYGIAANAFDEEAICRLYAVKRRAKEKGIPILIADTSDLEMIASEIPSAAEELINRFWPGPLTLVLPKKVGLPRSISGSDTVAVRLPSHSLCRSIIRAAGGALATSSANLSNRAPAQSAETALEDLAGKVAVVIDSGSSGGQVASTVVDCTRNSMRIIRPGPLSLADLMWAVRS